MIASSRKPNRRWVAPAAAASLVIASPAIWTAVATAEPTLPDRNADQIIADVLAARPVAMAGEISQRIDLGLPDLGQGGGLDLTNPQSIWTLASGTNTWRIWYDGQQSYRISIIQGAAESDLISNGAVLWAWSSQNHTAIRHELGATAEPDHHPVPQASPAQAAQQILAQLEAYSTVATDANVRVAGRAAYELVITPNDDQTRVQQVRLAVDAETSLPLRVQVYAASQDSAVIEIGFTRLSYDTPNASVFEFTPPPGAEIIEADEQSPAIEDAPGQQVERQPGQTPEERLPATPPVISGAGWSTVRVASLPVDDLDADLLRQYLTPVQGDWGSGVVLDGTLFSVVVTDDGRVAVGAVAPEVLYQALR